MYSRNKNPHAALAMLDGDLAYRDDEKCVEIISVDQFLKKLQSIIDENGKLSKTIFYQ